jgi:hypothetical protein
MAYFAVIADDKVKNVIVADNLEMAVQVTNSLCVEYEHGVGAVGIGWTYKEGIFAPPVIELLVPVTSKSTTPTA